MSNPLRCAWHCVRPDQTWPGCGHCAGCTESQPMIFDAARRLLAANQRLESALVCIDHELRLEGI